MVTLDNRTPRSRSLNTVEVRLDVAWDRAAYEDDDWLRRALTHHIESVGRELTGGVIRVESVAVVD